MDVASYVLDNTENRIANIEYKSGIMQLENFELTKGYKINIITVTIW
jgi:hypothetical protein